MASKVHQTILGLVARKIRQEGYEIVCFDGNEKLVSNVSLNIPPTIKRHRPDIVGYNFQDSKICIGEAKTCSDIRSDRTKEQLLDFSKTITSSGKTIKLIIGIPQSGEKDLARLLHELNILKNPNVSYIQVPDELLEEDDEKDL